MRIVVLASSYPRFHGDGTAPFVQSISEHLAKIGHQVEVVAPYDPQVVSTEQGALRVHRFRYVWPDRYSIMGHARALEADVRLRPLSFLLLPLFLISAFFTLYRVARKQKSDAIYVHWVIPNGPVAAWVAALRKIPFIISLHGSDIYLAKKNSLFGRVARAVFRWAAGVTACSPELHAAALSLGAPANTLLLPWGANPELFKPDKRNSTLREQLGIDPQALVILAVGRMVYKKGFNILLEAIPQVLKINPNIHLILGGDGALRNELESQARQLNLHDKVSFPGRIPWDEMPAYLASGDIFCLPSILDRAGNLDGLPTVLPEALASGAAVIASDIGGVRLVIQAGQNGLLVKPGHSDELAAAITSLVEQPELRRQLGQAARQSVLDRYNWTWVARQIGDLLEKAAWQHAHATRLGTVYRDEMVKLLDKRPKSGWVLDVGCHDGYWLSTLDSRLKVGIDPEPAGRAPGTPILQADGLQLPFAPGAFHQVYAMDVIEHVPDDTRFAQSISSMLAPGGSLFLSTPSLAIRLNPPFLTRWISLQWGHTLRLGYTAERLEELFGDELDVKVTTWNAPGYRFWYLPIRFFSALAPHAAARWVRRIARSDSQRRSGIHGFMILEGRKPEAAMANPD